MRFDLEAILRRRKPDKRLAALAPRAVGTLLHADDVPPGIVPLVPDTDVYIRNAAGTLPTMVEELLDRSQLFHCTVCLAELATGIAHADPRHASWRVMRDHYASIMAAIPGTRVLAPDEQVWADAAVLSGTLARAQGFQRHRRKEALNDALILLTAAKVGLPVLTANRDDFDLLQQLAPDGRFYHF